MWSYGVIAGRGALRGRRKRNGARRQRGLSGLERNAGEEIGGGARFVSAVGKTQSGKAREVADERHDGALTSKRALLEVAPRARRCASKERFEAEAYPPRRGLLRDRD